MCLVVTKDAVTMFTSYEDRELLRWCERDSNRYTHPVRLDSGGSCLTVFQFFLSNVKTNLKKSGEVRVEHSITVREMDFVQGRLSWRVWCSALMLSN